jgi:hypothetical protein
MPESGAEAAQFGPHRFRQEVAGFLGSQQGKYKNGLGHEIMKFYRKQ